MTVIRYLLDEHVSPRLRNALLRRSPEMVAWCVGDAGAPPLQASDPDILDWCEAHGFSLVTNNRASIPVHLRNHLAAGRHLPGIFVLNPSMKTGELLEELNVIWAASEAEEYTDQIRYLPIA